MEQGSCWKSLSSHPTWLDKSDILVGICGTHSRKNPSLGIFERRALQAAFTQVRDLQDTPNHTNQVGGPERPGKLGRLVSVQLFKVEAWGGDRGPGWAPPALVSPRAGGSHGPKKAIGVSPQVWLPRESLAQGTPRHGFGGGSCSACQS